MREGTDMVGRTLTRRSSIGTSASAGVSATENSEDGFGRLDSVDAGGGGCSTSATTLTPPFAGMTRIQLRRLLRERGLSTWGSKAHLIGRLDGSMLEKTGGDGGGGGVGAFRRSKEVTSLNGAQRSSHERSEIKNAKPKSTEGHGSNVDPDSLTLWQHPLITLNYFIRELLIDLTNVTKNTLRYKKTVWLSVLVIGLFIVLSRVEGPQQNVFKDWEAKLIWWAYWVGLGVLSSVGLGTGLHTFVLYLGPHIAAVTMAAYECGGLNFPEPPYPDQIVCPTEVDPTWTAGILNIMRKVRVEAMLWGAGTALGELPPYFMARAARTSRRSDKSQESDQEDLKELEALEALESGENVPIVMRVKLAMKHFVQRAGFLGILACASIPNPLFDLAGLTCGHYLIPFWTFFGATLIGKAVVKMHIQQMAVIIAFNEELLDKVIGLLAIVPYVGHKFQAPLKKYLMEQKKKLHEKSSAEGATTISWLFDKFVMLMVCYFLVTIIHALARNHHRRRTKTSAD